MKKTWTMILTLALVLALLAGCGGSSGSFDKTMAAQAPMEEAAAMDNGAMLTAESGSGLGDSAPAENRKWIVTVFLSAETEDLEAMNQSLEAQIHTFGGYVESKNVYNGSAYAQRRYRSANLTIRIPAEKVESFISQVGEVSNIVSQEVSREDITLTYVATESRMKALQTEEARLLELLGQAENMADLLEIEARLTDVRYELEAVTSQMRLYDNQVDYATIHLNISEVQEYTPVEEPTLWERISGGFVDSLKGVGEGAVDLLVWIIASSPYLVVWGVVIVLAVMLLRKVRKTRRDRKKPKE